MQVRFGVPSTKDEQRHDTIRRISEELVEWHRLSALCEPGYEGCLGSWASDSMHLHVRMDERTAPKWRSFAMSMIDLCETRLREFTQ